MKMLKALSILILLSAPAFAAEADQYSVPDGEIADITYELNENANRLVGQALERLNSEGGCSAAATSFFASDPEEILYDDLKRLFNIHGRSVVVDDILQGRMPRTVILLDDSIYKDWDMTSGVFLSRSQLTLSPNIKVGGKVIGVDKLEHMFGYGLKYFRRHYLKGMDLEKVLKLGAAAEKVYLGGNVMATGVFAYADQAANFTGMRFWNHLLQRRDDVLGREYNIGPYISCEAGKWKQVKPIDLSAYVDKSFQENYNCSKFATQSGLEKFNAGLAELKSRNGGSNAYSCPVSLAELDADAAKFEVPLGSGNTIGHWIINRDGNQTVSYTHEFN